jgi:excisionase family DNA binding protein
MPQPNEQEYLTVGEVASVLGVTEKTVRRLIDRGELIAYKISERKTYVRREDLDAYIESGRTAAR